MTAVSIPQLCVVGHPNKGKSSIVSTLAENDSVRIGVESGTTRHADTFEFIVQGRVMLALTDTPGFQRARQVLAWLQAEAVSPSQRPERVRAFLARPEHRQRFPDECELLDPIMAGAGILYVVDAAQPVTAADEAEMEILRWTGQPRMAVINPMDPEHADPDQAWQRTLNQYFQWVRVFNPLTAALPARQSLLRAVGELTAGWSQPINRLCRQLEQRDRERLQAVSHALGAYWSEQLTLRLPLDKAPEAVVKAEEQLRQQLNAQEQLFFHQLAVDWGHRQAALQQTTPWDLTGAELMQTETWYLWGLRQHELLLVAGSAGAAGGLAVDVGLGGSSLLLGALSGGVLGTAGGWLASRERRPNWLGRLAGGREKRFAGPVRHPNFPLVVMARALTLTQQLWLRPHARRDILALRTSAEAWSRSDQVRLLQWARALQRPYTPGLTTPSRKWTASAQQKLVSWIHDTLNDRLQRAWEEQTDKVWRHDEHKPAD
ncbi:DUF3482 domain-containing protein [Natronospirillum operosum]|uniref:DUF3482 domain-containing protein n=1 Tax=Natronospirillum operosum TaxID=2759953 RepID=A0A4Z0W5B1_9GAMM|nr:DUF3482 domain-containing protein [Natronospirillum operosum]TGG90794.1 DUF3482 domain-containing protein [Natronospirillum operosum]